MSKERQPTGTATPDQEPITLNDLAARVDLLTAQLLRLTESAPEQAIQQDSPGEEVDMTENEDSIIVKAGSKTYFFDLKQTRDNIPYLLLTESRYKGEGEERERVSITIFPESAGPFGQAVAEMMTRLGHETPR